MSKKWMDSLPADLQKIVRDDAAKVTKEITPFVRDFFAEQTKIFVANGGNISKLPKAEYEAMTAKVSSIGDDCRSRSRRSTRRSRRCSHRRRPTNSGVAVRRRRHRRRTLSVRTAGWMACRWR